MNLVQSAFLSVSLSSCFFIIPFYPLLFFSINNFLPFFIVNAHLCYYYVAWMNGIKDFCPVFFDSLYAVYVQFLSFDINPLYTSRLLFELPSDNFHFVP